MRWTSLSDDDVASRAVHRQSVRVDEVPFTALVILSDGTQIVPVAIKCLKPNVNHGTNFQHLAIKTEFFKATKVTVPVCTAVQTNMQVSLSACVYSNEKTTRTTKEIKINKMK